LEKEVVVRFPKVFANDTRAVAAHINGGGNFERSCSGIRQLHEHLEEDAVLGATEKGSVHERDPAQPYFFRENEGGAAFAAIYPTVSFAGQ